MKIMKVIRNIMIATVVLFVLGGARANAATIESEKVVDGVKEYVVNAEGEDDYKILMKCLRSNGDDGVKLTLKPGTYEIDKSLHAFNNTEINAKGATIVQKTPGRGILISARYKNSYYGNATGKYTNSKNIKVVGGNWNSTCKPDTSKTKKSNGYYVGFSTFLFMHGENITIQDASFKNNYNGHFIEFAGIKNGKIINCNLDVKGSKYVGEDNNEAIQIDTTYAKENLPVGEPWDNTPSKDIVISGCKIRFVRGIGTNLKGNAFYENISIVKNSIIATKGEGVNAYDIKGFTLKDNTIKVTHKAKDYRSTGVYLGLDTKVKNPGKYKTVISGNKITGYHSGLKIVAFNGGLFGTITLKDNVFMSTKSKADALTLAYKGKQIKKLINKNNKLKKA